MNPKDEKAKLAVEVARAVGDCQAKAPKYKILKVIGCSGFKDAYAKMQATLCKGSDDVKERHEEMVATVFEDCVDESFEKPIDKFFYRAYHSYRKNFGAENVHGSFIFMCGKKIIMHTLVTNNKQNAPTHIENTEFTREMDENSTKYFDVKVKDPKCLLSQSDSKFCTLNELFTLLQSLDSIRKKLRTKKALDEIESELEETLIQINDFYDFLAREIKSDNDRNEDDRELIDFLLEKANCSRSEAEEELQKRQLLRG